MALLQIEGLTFAYPTAKDKKVLDSIDISIEKGSYNVLCGRSGSGKTTLLRHLKSALTPHGIRSGSILFHGAEIDKVSQRDQSCKIGYVMQNPDDQIVTDKVWHELAFGLESLGTEQKTMRVRVAEMACYFGIQDWFHRDVSTLSGGQKQLLNLASIMAMQPELLILDEPTSQLDPIAAADFLNTVRKINTELGTTIIITEHRLEDILPYADRAIVMDDGKVIADGKPQTISRKLFELNNEMFTAMPTPVRVFFGANGDGESPLTVRDGRNWLDSLFTDGVTFDSLPTAEPDFSANPPALTAKELWFRYEKDSPDILRGVNAEIPSGCLYAIVGGNGAGKSTALKAFCGICRPYRGKVKIFGKTIKKYKSEELYKNCIALLPQDPKSLFVKKTVAEELSEMTKDSSAINDVTELCEISSLLSSHPYDLSGGEQQRVALAKVLLTEPRLLFLDEPTKGIDSFFKTKFASILSALKSRGITIVMVSHDVEFCAEYADYVSMFFDGQILTTDTPHRFFGNNSFYTTAANRMSRHIFSMAVTVQDIIELINKNREEKR